MAPKATIVISTRNRKNELRTAIISARAQDIPVEILVYDDASEDGTSDAIRSSFPDVRVLSNSTRLGLVENRDRAFKDANTPYIFSLDDDAYFTDVSIVSDTLKLLESGADIAAVAIPYIEPQDRRSLSSLQSSQLPPRPGESLRSFVGCAYAIKRSIALSSGGYRGFFIHQCEERDLCIRLIDCGFRIVMGSSAPIVHSVSKNRDETRVLFYAGRNQLLHALLNVPFPDVLVRAIVSTAGYLRYRLGLRTLPLKFYAILCGLAEFIRKYGARRPVSRASYRRYRSMAAHGAIAAHYLPPPCSAESTRAPANAGINDNALSLDSTQQTR